MIIERQQDDKYIIPINWHRIQTVPFDNQRYNSLVEFFNAMVSEYKIKIENHSVTSYNIMITYHDDNSFQKQPKLSVVELFPEEHQLDIIDDFVRLWCRKNQPKYLVRIHYAYQNKIKEPGFSFMAEDLNNFHRRDFRITENESSITLTEV
jgi:hypothetical protein